MHSYKVLVVDDSAFMRKLITDIISRDPQFEVIDTAKNGQEAIHKIRQLKPNIVTMDIEMPVMDGLEALQIIMNENPLPIIMLSSMTGSGTQETIRALELGAVDFIRKPSGSISLDLHLIQQLLIDKLRTGIHAKLHPSPSIVHRPASNHQYKSDKNRSPSTNALPKSNQFQHIVAIGTSTGGPKALQTVLSGLPPQLIAPILIVQHMPPNFTKSLAIRLDTYCPLQVVEAENGMKVNAGTVYIAPGGWHMTMIRGASGHYNIHLDKEELRFGHRPSVDVLFESLLPFHELKRHIVIMTGMGSDGAKSMKRLKDNGATTTIAESEQSCVVYGMPRAAIELGGVDYILKQQDISKKIIDLVQ